jgi:hypothetical protein
VPWLLLSCTRPASPPPPPAPVLPATARIETYEELRSDAAAPRHPSDGGGALRWVADPGPLVAGSVATWSFALEIGPQGIADGGAIWFLPAPFWGWSPPQDETPEAPGFTALEAPAGVALETEVFDGMLRAVVRGRALAPGEVVGITYGPARADRFAERATGLWVAVDGDGDGVRQILSDGLVVETVAGDPAMVVATLPSAAGPGDTVTLRVAVLDAVGNAFRRTDVSLAVTADEALGLPPSLELAPSPDGTLAIPIRPAAPGVYTVTLTGPATIRTESNPLVVRPGAIPIAWGDLHTHSAWSDGTGDAAGLYRYARDVAGLDIAAVTDHDHWGMVFLDQSPERVTSLAAAAEVAHRDGTFVALHGYEWTSWLYGHRHVLFFDSPRPWLSSLDPLFDHPTELWDALRGTPAITIPHHPAGGPIALDWSIPSDPQVEPVVEVASVHGQSESPALPGGIYDAVSGTYVEQHLAGQRLGMIGSTDSHDGHPGLSQIAGGRGGLAAFEGATLTRMGVLESLRARRVYATNGPRIVLRFTAAGQPMGSELPAGVPTDIEVRVVGTAPIDRVELVGRAGTIGSRTGDGGRTLHATWTLDTPAPGDLAYVRVVQADGGLAWSSPVWFH